MTQLEQLKAEAQDELEVAVMGLINRFVLDNCGKEIGCMSLGQFVVPDLVKESLSHLIETVYQARTEEIQHVIGEARDNNRHNATEYGEGVYEGLCHAHHLIATLKDTKNPYQQ